MESTQPSHSEKVASILDVRKLAIRCVELERQLEQEQQESKKAKDELLEVKQREVQLSSLAEAGKEQLQRQKQEILSCLRAIVHHSGDQVRLQKMERLLQTEEIEPELIKNWHQSITGEFRSLYPSRPISKLQAKSQAFTNSTAGQSINWNAYQIAS